MNSEKARSLLLKIGANVMIWVLVTGVLLSTGLMTFGDSEPSGKSTLYIVMQLLIHLTVLFIIPVYVHNLALMRFFFFRQNYVSYAASALGLVLIISFFDRFISERPFAESIGTEFMIIVIGASFYTSFEALKNKMRLDKAREAQIGMELKLLKEQVNPHFLYNALNNLYYQAMFDKDSVADSLLKLSELMRYTTETSQKERVPLAEEIQFIRHFIDLQAMRSEKAAINVEITGDTDGLMIAPMLLIPFVENSFKHGTHATAGDSSIQLNLSTEGDRLSMKLVNTVPAQKTGDGLGTGLANTRKRLELMYSDRFRLVTQRVEDEYSVELELEL